MTPFRRRSLPVLFTQAARRGLEPGPATRFREARLSSLVEHHLAVFVAHRCPNNPLYGSCSGSYVRSSLSDIDTLQCPPCSSLTPTRGRPAGVPGFYRSFPGRIILGRYPDARRSFGSPQFPSYPVEHMTWSQTPVVTWHTRHYACRFVAFRIIHYVGFRSAKRNLSFRSTTIHFSGLNTGPAPLIHPAPDSRYRVCPRISLLSCWLSFTQAGLSPAG